MLFFNTLLSPVDSALLDYGNGLCDRFAALTVNGGNETSVLLD